MADAWVQGNRWIGRQNTRCKDSRNRDMESVGLKVEDVMDRVKWQRKIENYSSDSKMMGKAEEKKTESGEKEDKQYKERHWD